MTISKLQIHVGPDRLPRSKAGNPTLPRKDEYFTIRKRRGKSPTIGPSAYALRFRRVLSGVLYSAGLMCSKARPLLGSGDWYIHVHTFTSRRRSLLSDGLTWRASVDTDACRMPVLDALQWCGVIADDHLFEADLGTRSIRKRGPGILINIGRKPPVHFIPVLEQTESFARATVDA